MSESSTLIGHGGTVAQRIVLVGGGVVLCVGDGDYQAYRRVSECGQVALWIGDLGQLAPGR
jgi:hypothetical protein